MSLLFELCQVIPNAVMIASWMALAGVLATRCMPGANGLRVLMDMEMGKGSGRRLQGLDSVDISKDTLYGRVVKSLLQVIWFATNSIVGGIVDRAPQGSPSAPLPQRSMGVRHPRLSDWGRVQPAGNELPIGAAYYVGSWRARR